MMMLVLSADAFVRFRNGEVVVHNAHSAQGALASHDPTLVGFIARFTVPVDPDVLFSSLNASARAQAQGLVARLLQMGVLVDAARTSATRTSEQEIALSVRQLGSLADATHLLAADLQTLGPAGAETIARQTGIGLEARLASLLAAVDSLRAALSQVKRDVVSRQLTALGINAHSRNLRLHVGAGGHNLAGWINLDISPADLTVNVTEGLPLPDGSVACVFASHMLEHLYYPQQTLGFLAECHRVLAPGGVLRLIVPDIEQCIQAYVRRDSAFFATRIEKWKHWQPGGTPLEDFLAYAGAGPAPSYFLESHKYGFDYETLERALRRVGFAAVERSTFQGSRHPELRVDAASEVADARHGETYYSLFVEAGKARTAADH